MSGRFYWSYPGLDWSQFHSLANLLSLRNGGQVEPSSFSNTVLDENWDSDDSGDAHTSSIDTGLANQISDSGHGSLKQKFLDRMAEFAANESGGTAVACSIMREAENNVIIWIARNNGFSDVDRTTFDKLGNLLGCLSCNNYREPETPLWEEMVSYQQNRIKNSYIPKLRTSFAAYDAVRKTNDTHTPESSSVADALSVLRTHLFDGNIHGTSTLQKYTRLAMASYNLRRTRIVEVLYSSPSATSRSKSLWLDICMFARIRVAFENFKDIAVTLPSFAKVTIVLVPRPPVPTSPSQRPLTLDQIFGILQLDLGPPTTELVLGQNWTMDRIGREFAKRQKQKLNVHAEVQMLMFLNTNESSKLGVVPYMGCSKLSYFMCNCFLRSYGQFKTRGCHGRLFRPWTVPHMDRLLPRQAERIAEALISVQRAVEEKLIAPLEGRIQHERTSVIGGSSIRGGGQEDSQRQLQISQLRMEAERDKVAGIFRRQSESINHPNLEVDERESDCEICMRQTTRQCSRCQKGFFYSASCEKKIFRRHLFTCPKRPITSADHLKMPLLDNLIPQDEDVLEDFRFNNIPSHEMPYLFGLYQGLLLLGKFSAEEIHEWRIEGILADKIKEFYYSLPESSRGGYFPWFLKNPYILEYPTTAKDRNQKLLGTFYDKAKPYLNVADRKKAARDIRPEAKRVSYHMLAEVLLRVTPNPIEGNWYSFGFVTCGEDDERLLLDLYQLLLTKSDGSMFYEIHNRQRVDPRPVTFTQFWKAYQTGTLVQLMDSKGLKDLRSRLPFLEGFLSVPPGGPQPSVWNLKTFIEINDPIQYPPVQSVNVDYGFINCRTVEDMCILMEIYGKVLKIANPLGLHQACVAGDLVGFASGYVDIENRWRPLLRNFYPLGEDSASVPSL
ncbi:hypothetical protein P280DRAFT_428535 [Massarina eburnea CBS 473.64]|uniref:Suppressor of anucleate metulae protein B n=1 Tax=Massarina eburnea CBS 473.64 TaxID=1395130 RepID=A0A6A6RVS0_9PLEO|nr:hypothetical protein P280DRAFT_428535 [Massarina eburnea CBS 473.64]